MFKTLRILKSCSFNPEIIIDIGASDGRWSESCMKIFPKALYLLFEPLEERMNDLNIFQKSHTNVKIFNFALSNYNGTANFRVNKDDLFSSNITWATEQDRVIKVKKLDDVLKKEINANQKVDLVKIDVQGHEKQVLEGALDTLLNCRFIILEIVFNLLISNTQQLSWALEDVVHWMSEHNFIPFDICGTIRRPTDNLPAGCDILFCNKNDFFVNENKGWFGNHLSA